MQVQHINGYCVMHWLAMCCTESYLSSANIRMIRVAHCKNMNEAVETMHTWTRNIVHWLFETLNTIQVDISSSQIMNSLVVNGAPKQIKANTPHFHNSCLAQLAATWFLNSVAMVHADASSGQLMLQKSVWPDEYYKQSQQYGGVSPF